MWCGTAWWVYGDAWVPGCGGNKNCNNGLSLDEPRRMSVSRLLDVRIARAPAYRTGALSC